MKRLFMLIIAILLVIAGGYIHYKKEIQGIEYSYNRVIEIERGESLSKVFKDLGIWDNVYLKLYLRERDGGRGVKAGYYELNGRYTIKEIIDILEEGRDKVIKFTIPEGTHLDEIINNLSKAGFGSVEELDVALRGMKFPYPTPNGNYEGYIYPDTYYIPVSTSEEKVWSIFLDEFLEKFPVEEYPDKEYFYNRLILASIIEREARVWDEKETISSVFNNRIEKNMKLESDATVNYVFNYDKKRIYYKDLKVDSPYNTYMYRGLPPHPISNPDYRSVSAAYAPIKSNYLFFVAVEDGSGRHYFSNSYSEHLRFIKQVRDKNREKK